MCGGNFIDDRNVIVGSLCMRDKNIILICFKINCLDLVYMMMNLMD